MRQKGLREKSRESSKDKYRINDEISANEVRLIGAEGDQLGVKTFREAMAIAEEAGLDLVEVAGGAQPPVCRILDYGKLKYKEQKKAAETRKRSSTTTVKELRIRYSTDKHDLDTKIRQARNFLEQGDRVRFQMRFRGREVVYRNLGEETFRQVTARLEDIASVEEFTPMMNQRMILSLVPKSQAGKRPDESPQ